MNLTELNPSASQTAHRVEFFRLPAPGKRDPYFGLSRSWYYKFATLGEITMVSIRQRGALRGVRLVAYDSVTAYVRRAAQTDGGVGTENQSDERTLKTSLSRRATSDAAETATTASVLPVAPRTSAE
ncbi:MAG: hypothetical protein ACREFX_02010 [Opitutaceae bacterium]